MNNISNEDAIRICELLSSIFFYGNFKAETRNEMELEEILKRLGYFFTNEDDLIKKLYDKPKEAQS